MVTLGRALQLFGLILLPAALLYGLDDGTSHALGIELSALALGGAAFFLGTKLLGKAK